MSKTSRQALPTSHVPDRPSSAAWLERARDAVLDLLFPTRCVGCGHSGAALCEACLARLTYMPPNVCSLCRQPAPEPPVRRCPTCARNRSPLAGCRSVAYSTGALREAIHRLKYDGQFSLARPLAGLLIQRWQINPLPVDLIFPIPLHPRREKERGYNQAALLARHFSHEIGLPLREDALIRTRDTRPQVGLDAWERRQNVDGAFECGGVDFARWRVLLVDDVMTTGATLEAAASAVKGAGARSVWALTLGRAQWGPG